MDESDFDYLKVFQLQPCGYFQVYLSNKKFMHLQYTQYPTCNTHTSKLKIFPIRPFSQKVKKGILILLKSQQSNSF